MKAINKFLKTLRKMPWMEWGITGERIRGVVVGGGDFAFCPITAVHFAKTGERLDTYNFSASVGLGQKTGVAVAEAADVLTPETHGLRRRLLMACRLPLAA